MEIWYIINIFIICLICFSKLLEFGKYIILYVGYVLNYKLLFLMRVSDSVSFSVHFINIF